VFQMLGSWVPKIEVSRYRSRKEKVVCVARPQKTQQERWPVCPTWEKVQEYCNK